jgi:hypothetical protein
VAFFQVVLDAETVPLPVPTGRLARIPHFGPPVAEQRLLQKIVIQIRVVAKFVDQAADLLTRLGLGSEQTSAALRSAIYDLIQTVAHKTLSMISRNHRYRLRFSRLLYPLQGRRQGTAKPQ